MDEKCDAKNVIIYKDEKNLIADVIKMWKFCLTKPHAGNFIFDPKLCYRCLHCVMFRLHTCQGLLCR
jgi:hypothetical protein